MNYFTKNAGKEILNLEDKTAVERALRRELAPALAENEVSDAVECLAVLRKSGEDVGFKLKANGLGNLARVLMERSIARRSADIPLLPPLYKGVSFNPSTFNASGRSEWLMLLDFFAFMRALSKNSIGSQTPIWNYAVLDASFYWIVNLLGNDGIKLTGGTAEEAAGELLALLKGLEGKKEFEGVLETSRVRNAYMRAIARRFPADETPPVFSIKDVWADGRFQGVLTKTLPLFCEKRAGGGWRVFDSVSYERYMPYSSWVTPLIAAEYAFLQEYCGFKANLAPSAEAAWDKIVEKACRNAGGEPYVTFMYSRKIASWLPYDSIPFFSDSEAEILRKISAPQSVKCGLPELAVRMVGQFTDSDLGKLLECIKFGYFKPVAKEVFSFCSEVDAQASEFLASQPSIPPTPLSKIGWLANFPAGIC